MFLTITCCLCQEVAEESCNVSLLRLDPGKLQLGVTTNVAVLILEMDITNLYKSQSCQGISVSEDMQLSLRALGRG